MYRNFLSVRSADALRTFLVLLALAAATAGCRSVQHAREVQDPASPLPGERSVSLAEILPDGRTALTVDEAVRLAISNSPAVFQARASLVVAESQLQITRATYLPQLSGAAGYSRAKSYSHPAKDAADSYNAGLSLGLDLLSFGRNIAALAQARAQYDAATAQLASAINTAAYNARHDFFGLVLAQDLLVVAVENVRDFSSHLEQVRVMAELGTRIRYDITTAEVDLGNARLGLLSASNTLLTARVTLGRTLGLTEEFPCPIAAPPSALPLPTEDRQALYARARRGNPDLAALQCQVDAASAAVDYAVADLRPDLSLGASLAWSGATFPLARKWSLGPSLDWTLFDSGHKVGVIDAAAANLQASRSRMADREQRLFQDLITALIQLQTARAQSAVAEVVVRAARETLDLVTSRYRLGLATSLELTDAELAVAQARSQQAQARHDELAAQALILLNTGDVPPTARTSL